ncbi:MAG: hypothetical protein ACYS8O_00715 [Planctomycetota bacterium]|jgi:hypothetical protein
MKQLSVISLLALLCLCGCEGFRYPATEAQKQNAWLHGQVCAAAADTAADENASTALCQLTEIAHDQSTAFVADYGLPRQAPVMEDVEAIAKRAQVDAAQKPDAWVLAEGAMELGIAIAGFVGGVYGIRIAGYLRAAREKSKALKEIVAGNELFKQLWPEHADRFKEAQRKQTPPTRQIVTQLKTG